MASDITGRGTARLWPVGLVVLLPLVGLAVLLARPELDVEWEHHPSHFWLVLVAAAVNVVLAYVTNVAAGRYRDARLTLISLAFLSTAGFLGLHALATPGVLLDSPNIGFTIATPLGLIIASGFSAASATRLAGPRAMDVLRARPMLLVGLIALMVGWAVFSIARIPPLDGPPPSTEGGGVLNALSLVAVGLFGYAAIRLFQYFRFRGETILLAMAAAVVLLAEALIAIIVSRNWHISWWEWHLLLLAAFLTIALAARHEYQRRGSLTGAFGGLYLEATLARVDRWYASAVAAVAASETAGQATDDVLAELRREGATDEEVALLAETAREVNRLDASFRPFLPGVVSDRLRSQGSSSPARPIGDERTVSAMFADLAGFTPFSERHEPREVMEMLNGQWETVVPIVERAGGTIEHFAGDGVLVLFNAAGDQPDHARRAARAAAEVLTATREIAASHPGWPIFRIGINTGPALVGVLGTAARQSFAAIGDPVNTAARLQTAAEPGQVVVGRATWEALDDPTAGEPLGGIRLKGKRDPVEAWRLTLPGDGPPTAGP
jgi:adenylate cyclase